ncbi:MAG: MarR family transcriptional regulator [Eubacteriales bacterium]|nr:MarR family transcriptional regulator [Eubacteriales bacterium]
MEKSLEQQFQERLFWLECRRRELMKPKFLELGLALGQGQPRILKHLYGKEPCSQRELADVCHLDVTTMSRTLDRMAQMGLIERRTNPDCRRASQIFLTPGGRETAAQVKESFREIEEQLCRGFSREELEVLNAGLERALENLEKSSADGRE